MPISADALDELGGLLVGQPPSVVGAVCPPPLVMGDAGLAAEVVRRMAIGWREIGQRFPVHVLTDAVDPVAAAEALQHAWRTPDGDRATIGGVLVVLAFDDARRGADLQERLAAALPGPRVLMLGDRPVPSRSGAVRGAFLDELRLWGGDSVVGQVAGDLRGPAEWQRQPVGVQESVAALAEHLPELLGAGGLVECATGEWQGPVLASPAAVLRMATAVDALLGCPDADASRSALELAGRLGSVVGRAGLVLRQTEHGEPMLSEDAVDTLARLAHEGYRHTAEVTRNATGSTASTRAWQQLPDYLRESNRAQVADIPVKLARLGWGWRVAAEDDEIARIPEDAVEHLAEMEHRRWAAHQARTGRPEHQWNRPWSDLSAEVKEYDRDAVRAIPAMLRAVGVGVSSS